MAKTLYKDNYDWDLIASLPNAKVFVAKRNYFPNVTHFQDSIIVKMEATVRFPYHKVITECLPLNNFWAKNPLVLNLKQEENYDNEQLKKLFPKVKFDLGQNTTKYSHLLEIQGLKVPSMAYNALSYHFDEEEGQSYLIAKSYVHESIKQQLKNGEKFNPSKKYNFNILDKNGKEKTVNGNIAMLFGIAIVEKISDETVRFLLILI
jgi:hypothetical protein